MIGNSGDADQFEGIGRPHLLNPRHFPAGNQSVGKVRLKKDFHAIDQIGSPAMNIALFNRSTCWTAISPR